jgi:hypothetical protein
MLFLARIEEAITLDPAWRGGDYDPDRQPLAGLTVAFNIITVQARGEAWANGYGRVPADPSRDPYRDRAARFTFQTELGSLSVARARLVDANQFLWLNRANMLHDLAHGYPSEREAYARIRARLLLLNASSDLWFPPHQAEEFAAAVDAAGGRAEARAFATDGGHLAGLGEPRVHELQLRQRLAERPHLGDAELRLGDPEERSERLDRLARLAGVHPAGLEQPHPPENAGGRRAQLVRDRGQVERPHVGDVEGGAGAGQPPRRAGATRPSARPRCTASARVWASSLA